MTLTSDDVETIDEDDNETQETILQLLSPVPVHDDYASGMNISSTTDVDSYQILARSLAPFRCATHVTLSLEEQFYKVKNTKLTAYLNVRSKIQKVRGPKFKVIGDQFQIDVPVYEFKLGTVNNVPLYVLFQINSTCKLLRQFEMKINRKAFSKFAICYNKFLTAVIIAAARRMPCDSVTAMSGLPYINFETHGSYNIPTNEWLLYVDNVSEILSETRLSKLCGMQFLRFYMCQHEIRAPREAVLEHLTNMVEFDHDHMDIVQIHRADNLSCFYNDCLINVLIKLDGTGPRSLSGLLGKPTRGRLERFHIAFLKNYGFFNKYCLLHDEPRITFVQVYNAAAKIARPINGHVLPMAILCRMFLNVDDARTSRILGAARRA